MSWWSYIHGTIIVSPTGRTQAEKRYVLDTVLDHLPRVTGFEGDMEVYVIQKRGHNSSCSCDEFGQRTNNLVDWHGNKSQNYGMLRVQDEYMLVVDGALRDRDFEDTLRTFQKWLIRLSKRVSVASVLVKINDYNKQLLIHDDYDYYWRLFEYPSGSRGNKTNEPAWYEYLLWQPTNSGDYPRILAYKYFDNEENDKQVEAWLDRGGNN